MRGALAVSSLLFFLVLFYFSVVSAFTKQGQVYIVYLGEHAGSRAKGAILEDHHALLLSIKGSEEETRVSMLYSYKHTLNGFAAVLSEEEATKLSAREEVVSTFPSEGRLSPHTTRSWEFMGFEEGLGGQDSSEWLPSGTKGGGEDVIVGMLDSGIWPESRSFGDEVLGPVPARWKGVCQGGDSFNSSSCNSASTYHRDDKTVMSKLESPVWSPARCKPGPRCARPNKNPRAWARSGARLQLGTFSSQSPHCLFYNLTLHGLHRDVIITYVQNTPHQSRFFSGATAVAE